MGEILFGTASWTDPTPIKSRRFYPPQAKIAEDRLRYYATQFNMVERQLLLRDAGAGNQRTLGETHT